uniref:Ubiquitin-conjugating enzyme E2 J2 n=1 Tax=Hirondellea gigas TaxID=1518452 RepID=A0A6A7G9F7_9CRUS
MASYACMQRLQRELTRLKKDPLPNIEATPLESNILEWHYIIIGPADSPYSGGIYHGKLQFPQDYPFKPPSIFMITPNGRFKTNTRLCLSMSDFHPELWNPLWSVSSILSGLLSFMLDSDVTYGSLSSTRRTKRIHARKSLEFNIGNKLFVTLFPHWKTEFETRRKQRELSGESHSDDEELVDDKEAPKDWTDRVAITFFVVLIAFAVSCLYS